MSDSCRKAYEKWWHEKEGPQFYPMSDAGLWAGWEAAWSVRPTYDDPKECPHCGQDGTAYSHGGDGVVCPHCKGSHELSIDRNVVVTMDTIEECILTTIREAKGEDPSMDDEADAWLFSTKIYALQLPTSIEMDVQVGWLECDDLESIEELGYVLHRKESFSKPVQVSHGRETILIPVYAKSLAKVADHE